MDSRLNFSKHTREAIIKATKGLSILKFLSKYVSRKVLDLSYKLYVRPHLDYGDVIYHNQRNDLMKLIEQVQYKAALIVSGCWQGTSCERLYDELGWESLSSRRWFRRMVMFYKIHNGLAPDYLGKHIPVNNPINISLRKHITKPPFSRTETYSKLLTKIRVNFSDLRDHRFNHNFNCENPTCACGLEDETPVHYFLSCPRYINQRTIYLGKISESIGTNVNVLPKEHLTQILMYGSNVYNNVTNNMIINETIYVMKKSGRFKKLEAFN